MSELSGIKFRPVMGPQSIIENTVQSNGYLYVATDSGNMYLDVDNHRISIGGEGSSGGSSSFVWANGNDSNITKATDDDSDFTYLIDISALDVAVMPKANVLILNSDGRFFRVLSIDENDKIVAELIAVSGSGGGGGGGGPVAERDVNIEWDSRTISQGTTYIFGQHYDAVFTPTTTAPGDTNCVVTFTMIDRAHDNATTSIVQTGKSGQKMKFDTANLPQSSNITLQITVTSDNSQYDEGRGYKRNITGLKCVAMSLEKDNTVTYIPIVPPDALSRTTNVRYIPYADESLTVTQHVYIDEIEQMGLKKNILPSNLGRTNTVAIPSQPHGVHNISIKLSANINGTDLYTNAVYYQAAWAEQNNDTPIIWLGKYDELIVNYETSYIEFMVYDPVAARNSADASVTLYKENVEVGKMDVAYSDVEFAKWDISTIYEVGENNYSIACRTSKVNISNEVTTVGSRDLGLEDEDALMLNFSTAGRSNSEVLSQRIVFKDKKNNTPAVLSGFNWKNNGWGRDAVGANGIDNGSYLNIANNATVTIPFQSLTLNAGNDYTIEMRYRIKNVQKYSTLVKSYAKYFINVGTEANPVKSSSSYTMAEIKAMAESQGHEIPLFYDQYGSPVMDENVAKEWEKVEGVVCKWMTGNFGLCIGTQEAYFASPRGVVSVRYKEDEIINISVVISKTDHLCYIYLNGILSGADSLPPADAQGAFNINSNFVINSDYCDIDLFRFRVYQGGLSMPQVIHNYLSDIHSIVLYDQNQLTSAPTKLSYTKLLEYNTNHPETPTMPYATWKIISDNKKGDWGELLPYYKGNKCICEVNFVNPPLDKALEDGLIDEWYYYTHCPSYRSVGVEIDVQGTSSQGYPRRNYKTKFKKAAPDDKHPEYGWYYTKGSLVNKRVDKGGTVMQTKNAKGEDLATPVERTVAKKWHMDNEALGTNKFTWKIDYMESSGTYNTGYANLMGNMQHPLYTQHPLDFYNISSISTEGLRTSVYGFPLLVFHEYANDQYNPSEQGVKYEYVGRYNMNLDKSSNEYYGFELEKEQPYIDQEWDEMEEYDTGEVDGDGNAIMAERVKTHHLHPWISQIAECWELSDNQGKWCSWKYPNAAARQTKFRTLQSGYDDRYEMMLHFEYRYSYYGDQLDAIGADGNYDGSSEERAKFADEIGTSHLEMSEYAYQRYKNLEAVFDWLDSTDQDAATNQNLSTPLQIRTPKPYSGQGEVSEAVIDYSVATEYDGTETYYVKNGSEYEVTTTFAEDEAGHITGFAEGVVYYVRKIVYYNTTFTKDSAGYRLEKFRREFDQHLNKEYCLVYYVMTELLLCYDSRGKNMMFASFGPTATSNGNFVWFPIFYDIDTQLGLNNSGAYLWDYDANVSEDGLFSTPTSVLWLNLWDAFAEDIKGKYRALRGLDDKTNVVGSLSYENIAGAYTCDASVFDSYAMKGIRPTIAIGLDEYYKYFATTTASGVGYFNTDGDLIKEDSPTFAYACQGDKILTTELLLRNRLNYIDSWWMGGDYDIKKVKGGQLQLRVSGNRATLTSDKYLHSVPEGLEGTYTQKNFPSDPNDYGIDPYDAHPGYKLKPFLKQYISYFTDEVPGSPKPYTAGEGEEDGVWTNIPESTISAYMSTPETPNEQLNYIPGLDYLSSLGDLSTSYISEFILRRGKRLLDLILGSDAPGYKNEMIKSNTIFTLSMSAGDQENKPLMKKMVFTGLSSLDKTIDISGSAKLQEFRALNTRIPNLYLADGAPLHTLHLPNTIRGLSLVQDNELKRILTSRPDVWNASSPEDYKGLYIEGLTDAASSGTGHSITSLIVDGGGLGYEAYKLLEKYVQVKTIPANETDPNAGDHVRIGMLNQEWTPYVQVENGEAYVPGTQYYKLNDHNMFDTWSFTTATDWNEQILNGTLYTINAEKDAQKNTITNLDLLDKFLRAYDAAVAAQSESKWGMKDATAAASVPTITGTIFVNNVSGDPINEVALTDTYKVRWPSLTITAARINTANLSKYVRVYENGRIETLTIERTAGTTPILPTGLAPSQADYDFVGWSTENPNTTENPTLALEYNASTETYTTTNAWSQLHFDNNTDVITFYAIFIPHPYEIIFKYEDGTEIARTRTPFNTPIVLPSTIPYQDESDLPLTSKYAFMGWAYSPDGAVQPMATTLAQRDTTFYAIFEESSVYENAIDDAYLQLTLLDQSDANGVSVTGWMLGLNPAYTFRGKVTLPSWITDKATGVKYPVLVIKDGSSNANDEQQNGISNDGGEIQDPNNPGQTMRRGGITHIFFDTETGTPSLLYINGLAFYGCTKLKYVDIPASCFNIGQQAFAFSAVEFSSISAKVIAGACFNGCAHLAETFTINPSVETIYYSAFQGCTSIRHLVIGTASEPSGLQLIGDSVTSRMNNLQDITIYTDNPSNEIWQSEGLRMIVTPTIVQV